MELSPIGKDWSITSISDKLLRELRNFRIKIVPNVMHDTFSSFTSCWICFKWIGSESIEWFESIHVNMTILFEFLIKLFPKLFMPFFREISESISNSLFLLFFSQWWISFWGMWNILRSTIFIGKAEIARWNRLGEVYL